ncbi:MAG: hypothetical protein KAS72_15595 [Phycisphaerales bacterium]|nr:hypothetical protein [Phycisphaerales bacterium]
MLTTGQDVFLQLPTTSTVRLLHTGAFVEYEDGIHIAAFDEGSFTPEVDQEVFIYHMIRKEFMQQPACIRAIMQDESKLRVAFETTGDPVSAESRQCYRVVTALADLTTTIGDEQHCRLLDVSATGFSGMSNSEYPKGKTVEATLFFQGKEFKGQATIQSIKELDPGRTRYGLYCTDERGSDLTKGLQKISMAVQRQQLRRQAGAA